MERDPYAPGPFIPEWEWVRRQIEGGRHPSNAHLARLYREGDPPEELRDYIASRFAGSPGQRPFREPDGWEVRADLSERQAHLLEALHHVHHELRGWASAEAELPGEEAPKGRRVIEVVDPYGRPLPVAVPLRRIASRGLWCVREPKREARRIVGRAFGIAPATLEEWERQLRDLPTE